MKSLLVLFLNAHIIITHTCEFYAKESRGAVKREKAKKKNTSFLKRGNPNYVAFFPNRNEMSWINIEGGGERRSCTTTTFLTFSNENEAMIYNSSHN